MENRFKRTKIKRLLAFIFDIAFISLLAFILYMLPGLIFKIDSNGYQNFMIFPLLIIIVLYIFCGELIFKNTFGKYLFGIKIVDSEKLERPSLKSFIKRGILKIIFPIEVIVLLFSSTKRRLGDLWAKTVVVNKESNKMKPLVRLIIGIAVFTVLLLTFRISMGLAVRNTDFYNIGINHLKSNTKAEIAGLPKVINQTRCKVNFIVPISDENHDKYAIVYLAKDGNEWSVNKTDFIKERIIGFSYSFSYSSSEK